MKYFIALLAVVALVQAELHLTEEQKEKLKAHAHECGASSNVDKEVVKAARTGTFADDDKFKEFIFCMNKKTGFQNEAGDFQPDVFKTKATGHLTDVQIDEIITKCFVKKSTPQESAFESAKCSHPIGHKSF